ncbi:MAG: hypothetical protein R3185_03075, partial [Candidatus Thermoplasmatota archaeon]|nr:hypothetical protein [Candidatus Thermoplasmatota archaeon]
GEEDDGPQDPSSPAPDGRIADDVARANAQEARAMAEQALQAAEDARDAAQDALDAAEEARRILETTNRALDRLLEDQGAAQETPFGGLVLVLVLLAMAAGVQGRRSQG